MLEVTAKTLILEPQEVMDLERIITDEDHEAAYHFLKRSVYRKLLLAQGNRLDPLASGCHGPVPTRVK